MSPAGFARLLNASTKTVRSWDQGQRKPSQAALGLIQVFRHDPSGLLEVAGMSGPMITSSLVTLPQTGPTRGRPSDGPMQ
jgi:hypothetical protein